VFEEIDPGVFRVSRSTIRLGSEDEAEIIRKFGIGASELRDRSFTQEIQWPCEVISMVIESGRRIDKIIEGKSVWTAMSPMHFHVFGKQDITSFPDSGLRGLRTLRGLRSFPDIIGAA